MFGVTQIKDFYNTAKSGLSDLFSGGNDFKTIGGNTDVSFGAGAGTDYSTNNQNSFGGNNGMNFGGGQSQNQNFFGDSNNYGGFQQQNQPFGGYGGMQPFGGGYGGMQMPMFGGGYGGMQMPMFGGGYGGGYGGGMQSMYGPMPNYFGVQPNPFGNRGMGSIYGNYFGNNMGTLQLPYGQNMQQYRQPTPRIAEQSPDRYRTKPVEDVADAEPIPVNPTPKPDRQPSTGSIRYDNGRARFSNEPPRERVNIDPSLGNTPGNWDSGPGFSAIDDYGGYLTPEEAARSHVGRFGGREYYTDLNPGSGYAFQAIEPGYRNGQKGYYTDSSRNTFVVDDLLLSKMKTAGDQRRGLFR